MSGNHLRRQHDALRRSSFEVHDSEVSSAQESDGDDIEDRILLRQIAREETLPSHDLHYWENSFEGEDAAEQLMHDLLNRIGSGARRDLMRQRSCSDPTCFAGFDQEEVGALAASASASGQSLVATTLSPTVPLVSRRKSYQYPAAHDERKLQEINSKWIQMNRQHSYPAGGVAPSQDMPALESLALPPEVVAAISDGTRPVSMQQLPSEATQSEGLNTSTVKFPLHAEEAGISQKTHPRVVKFSDLDPQISKGNGSKSSGDDDTVSSEHVDDDTVSSGIHEDHTQIILDRTQGGRANESVTRLNFRRSLPHVDVSIANAMHRGSSLGLILNGSNEGAETSTHSHWEQHRSELFGVSPDNVHSGAWTTRTSWRGVNVDGGGREWSLGPLSPSDMRGQRYPSNFSTTSSVTAGGASHSSVTLGWQPGENDRSLEFDSVIDLLGELVTLSPDSGDENADLSCDAFLFMYPDYCTTRELVEGIISVVFNLFVEFVDLNCQGLGAHRDSSTLTILQVEQMMRNSLLLLFRWVNTWNGGRVLKQETTLRITLLRFLKALSRCRQSASTSRRTSMVSYTSHSAALRRDSDALGALDASRQESSTTLRAPHVVVAHEASESQDSETQTSGIVSESQSLGMTDTPNQKATYNFGETVAGRQQSDSDFAESSTPSRRAQSLWSPRSHKRSVDNDWDSTQAMGLLRSLSNSEAEGLGPLPNLSGMSLHMERLRSRSRSQTRLSSYSQQGGTVELNLQYIDPNEAVAGLRAWADEQQQVQPHEARNIVHRNAESRSASNASCTDSISSSGYGDDGGNSSGNISCEGTSLHTFPSDVCELAQRLYRILVASEAFSLANDMQDTQSFASDDDYFFEHGKSDGLSSRLEDFAEQGTTLHAGGYSLNNGSELKQERELHPDLSSDDVLLRETRADSYHDESYPDHHDKYLGAANREANRNISNDETIHPNASCDDDEVASIDSVFSDYQYEFPENEEEELRLRWSLPGPYWLKQEKLVQCHRTTLPPPASPAGAVEQVVCRCLRYAEKKAYGFTITSNPFHGIDDAVSPNIDQSTEVDHAPGNENNHGIIPSQSSDNVHDKVAFSTMESQHEKSGSGTAHTLRRSQTMEGNVNDKIQHPVTPTSSGSKRHLFSGSLSKSFRRVRSLTAISALASASHPSTDTSGLRGRMSVKHALQRQSSSGFSAGKQSPISHQRVHSPFHFPGKRSLGSGGSSGHGWNGRVRSLPRSFSTSTSGQQLQQLQQLQQQYQLSQIQQQLEVQSQNQLLAHAHRLLGANPRKFAQQLTLLLYQSSYQHIQPHMLMFRYTNTNDDTALPWPVARMIQFFLVLSWWGPTEVLANTTMSATDRINLLGFFVSLACELRELRNYHALFAVVAGLCQPMLGWVWAIAHKRDKERFLVLKRVVSSTNNYRVYRADLSKCDKNQPIIPYLGLVNRTLENLNRMRVPKSRDLDQDEKRRSDSVELAETLDQTRVNFGLCKRLYSAIASFLVGQSSPYWESGLRVNSSIREELADSIACTIPSFAVLSELSALAKHKFHRRKRERAFHGIRTGARSLQKSVSVTMRG